MISDNKAVTHSTDGILVERTLSAQDGWIVGSIQVESISREPGVVHVVEEWPESLPVESVGFKRDDPPSDGEITPERVSVTLPVQDTAVEVEYGIELADTVTDVAFGEPTIERIETTDPSGSVAQTDGGEQPVDESDDGEAGGAADSETGPAGTPAQSVTDSGSVPGEGAVQRTAPSPSSSVKDVIKGSENGSTGAGESDLSDADAPDGPAELAGGQSPRRSVEARLDWLSARVDEFAAYTSALETFLDEQGTAPEFIDRIDDTVDDLEAEIATVSAELDSIRASQETLGDELRERTTELDERLDDARRSVEDELDDVSARVDSEVDRLDSELGERDGAVDSLRSDYDALEGRVTALEDDIERNRETFEGIEADVSDVADDVDSLRAEMDALRSEVDMLTEFRASLVGAFDGTGEQSMPDDE